MIRGLFSILLLTALLQAVFQPSTSARPHPATHHEWSIISTSRTSNNDTLEYFVHVRLGDVDLGTLLSPIDPKLTNSFGSTQLFAFNVTQGPDPLSTQLGFVRGYNVQASYDSTPIGVEVENVSYDDGSLKGTIQLQGLIAAGTNEIAVVGGTGDFRGARGYGIVTQVSSSGNAVLYHHELHFL